MVASFIKLAHILAHGLRNPHVQLTCNPYIRRARQISEQTFHRWKREFGMMDVDQAKQLKELQKENARLKRMLADEMLGWQN